MILHLSQLISWLLSLFVLLEWSILYSILRLTISVAIWYITEYKIKQHQSNNQIFNNQINTYSLIIMPSIISYQFIWTNLAAQAIYIIFIIIGIYQYSNLHNKYKGGLMIPRISHIWINMVIIFLSLLWYTTIWLIIVLITSVYILTLRRI